MRNELDFAIDDVARGRKVYARSAAADLMTRLIGRDLADFETQEYIAGSLENLLTQYSAYLETVARNYKIIAEDALRTTTPKPIVVHEDAAKAITD